MKFSVVLSSGKFERVEALKTTDFSALVEMFKQKDRHASYDCGMLQYI